MNTPSNLNTNSASIAAMETRLPVAIDLPKFSYEEEKWSTSRTCNVESIASHWKNTPHLVRVFTDRKFGHHSMVMLRKDTFEHTIKILHDIQHGEIMVKANLEALFDQVKMVTTLFEQGSANIAQQQNETFTIAIRNLTRVTGQIQSVLQYVKPQKNVSPSELTADEQEELRKLESIG